MNFNDKAGSWDTEERIKRAELVASEIKKTVNIDNSWNALEYGCGTGLISFNLNNDLTHVTLADTSGKMIEVSKRKISESKAVNMEAVNIDADGLIKADKSFNMIFTSMVLHHIKDIKDIVSKFYRLLKRDGILCIIDLDEEDGSFHGKDFDGHFGFNQEKLKAMLENRGLSEVRSHTFLKDFKKTNDKKIEYSLFVMTGKK